MIRLAAADVIYTWRDATGSRAAPRVCAPSTMAPGQLADAAVSLAGVVGGVSDASCEAISLWYETRVSDAQPRGPQLLPIRALLVFACEGQDQWYVLPVPSLSGQLAAAAPGGQLVGLLGIDSLAAAIIAGPYCNPFGYNVVDLAAAFVQFRP